MAKSNSFSFFLIYFVQRVKKSNQKYFQLVIKPQNGRQYNGFMEIRTELIAIFWNIAIKNELLARKYQTLHYIIPNEKTSLIESDVDCSLDTFEHERTGIMQIFMDDNDIRHEIISIQEQAILNIFSVFIFYRY